MRPQLTCHKVACTVQTNGEVHSVSGRVREGAGMWERDVVRVHSMYSQLEVP